MFVIDSWRKDHLSPQVTPRLWKLAQHGIVWPEVVVGGSWTIPSFSCLLTGYGPWRFEWVGEPPHAFVPKHHYPTILGRLQQRGYVAGFWGSGIVATAAKPRWERWGGAYDANGDYCTADGKVGEILQWVNNHKRPFALLAHYWGAHAPYGLNATPSQVGEYLRNDEGYTKVVAAYRNALAKIDAEIATIVHNLPSDTLVLITADHGEDFGIEHPFRERYDYAYTHCVAWRDEAIIVSAILLGFGCGVVETRVRNYDLPATLWWALFEEDYDAGDGRPVIDAEEEKIGECWSVGWGPSVWTVCLGSRRYYEFDGQPQGDVELRELALRQREESWVVHEDEKVLQRLKELGYL